MFDVKESNLLHNHNPSVFKVKLLFCNSFGLVQPQKMENTVYTLPPTLVALKDFPSLVLPYGSESSLVLLCPSHPFGSPGWAALLSVAVFLSACSALRSHSDNDRLEVYGST